MTSELANTNYNSNFLVILLITLRHDDNEKTNLTDARQGHRESKQRQEVQKQRLV